MSHAGVAIWLTALPKTGFKPATFQPDLMGHTPASETTPKLTYLQGEKSSQTLPPIVSPPKPSD